jgi:hypothetical protein
MNPATSERFFASGNERSTLRLFDQNITDAGYKVQRSDSFAMVCQFTYRFYSTCVLISKQIVDLMNMNMQDSTLYVVITYDYFENKPAGMSEIKPIWLDVDQCGFSEAKAKSQTGSYSISSAPWRSNVDGELLVMGGMFITEKTSSLPYRNC